MDVYIYVICNVYAYIYKSKSILKEISLHKFGSKVLVNLINKGPNRNSKYFFKNSINSIFKNYSFLLSQ